MSSYLKDGDLEEGAAAPLYPAMTENPEMRWAFIRKIYSILTVQLLLTVATCAVVVTVHPIVDFLTTTSLGSAVLWSSLCLPFLCENRSHFLPISLDCSPSGVAHSISFSFVSRPRQHFLCSVSFYFLLLKFLHFHSALCLISSCCSCGAKKYHCKNLIKHRSKLFYVFLTF